MQPSCCAFPRADFIDALYKCINSWYEIIYKSDDTTWKEHAFACNTLIMVTDGSYIQNFFLGFCQIIF